MNNDIDEATWRLVCEQSRKWWGKLTDEDLERIGGHAERLADALQDKYGYTRQNMCPRGAGHRPSSSSAPVGASSLRARLQRGPSGAAASHAVSRGAPKRRTTKGVRAVLKDGSFVWKRIALALTTARRRSVMLRMARKGILQGPK